MNDEVLLVPASAMHARRRPWAILGVWAWQAALALVASGPAAAVARSAYGTDPRGDATLWEPGGHALLDLLAHASAGVGAVSTSAIIALTAGVVGGLVPAAALLVAIAHATRERRPVGLALATRDALRAFPPLLLLLALAGCATAAAAGTGVAAFDLIAAWTHEAMGEARAQALGAAVGLAFLVPLSVLGVVHDLARAAVVRFRIAGLRALLVAAATFRRAPRALWWSWAWRALAALAPPLLVALAAGRVGGRGGATLVMLALLHQAAIVARVALRASWLAKCLRSVDG